jgi:hypothetical protein
MNERLSNGWKLHLVHDQWSMDSRENQQKNDED